MIASVAMILVGRHEFLSGWDRQLYLSPSTPCTTLTRKRRAVLRLHVRLVQSAPRDDVTTQGVLATTTEAGRRTRSLIMNPCSSTLRTVPGGCSADGSCITAW